MADWGFDRAQGCKGSWSWLSRIQPFYVFFLCFFFVFLLIIHTLIISVRIDSPDDIRTMMDRAWVALVPWDSKTATLGYHTQKLLEAVLANEPLFPTHEETLAKIIQESAYVDATWGPYVPGEHQYVRSLLSGFVLYHEDIYDLLGKDGPQTYLVILQNAAEKRPNGGFFGSFARVVIDKGRVAEVEVIDSYLPGFDRPGTSLTGPAWLLGFLPEREIYFVGANKVGFTYHDGSAIKTLYEKSYPGQRVRGVIFVTTDMFTDIVPGFREQMWEWQFINASVDLIKGSNERGKKELYVDAANRYFRDHADELVGYMMTHIGTILEKRYVNIYVEDITGSMHTWLRENKLTTRFEEDMMYFWDSNISYSKVDMFVDKIIQFRDSSGAVVIETMEDIVPIGQLAPGAYTVTVIYNLHVPDYYVEYIRGLEQDYGIELTEREIHILALQPRRATRGVIYMPKHITVDAVSGDWYHEDAFMTPFSRNVYYKSKMLQNNSVSEVVLDIMIGEQ